VPLMDLWGGAMRQAAQFQAAGVDGCRGGWVIAVVRAGPVERGGMVKAERVEVVRCFAEVLGLVGDCHAVCVDIPIGLSEQGRRQCDVLARRLLGRGRGASVFVTPVRAALQSDSYTQANAITRRVCGRGLSRQSFYLIEKIRQVDAAMRPDLQSWIREVHPEVCFWVLNGGVAVAESKRSSRGQRKRVELLRQVVCGTEQLLYGNRPSGCSVDDILDALVAAWTAYCVAVGKVQTLPAKPAVDRRGLRMEIVVPIV